MALKEPLMVKTVLGNTDLTLEAKPGTAFRVWDIRVYNPASSYLTVKIDKATVGYFRVGGVLGSHLPFISQRSEHSHNLILGTEGGAMTPKIYPITNAGGVASTLEYAASTGKAGTYKRVVQLNAKRTFSKQTLLAYLRQQGLFVGFPIAEGQKMTFAGVKQANAIQMLTYEIYDPGDIAKDQENGSEAKSYLFLNYGNSGAVINKTGDSLINTPANPAEFPSFPYGKDVPALTEVDILGVLASDFAPLENDGTNYCLTNYLKLIRGQTTLFDEDLNGLLLASLLSTAEGSMDAVAEGNSVIGNYSDVDGREPFIFPQPLTFRGGEELNIFLTTTKAGTGQNISTLEQEVALIERVRRVG
jgi:hypothetical protein